MELMEECRDETGRDGGEVGGEVLGLSGTLDGPEAMLMVMFLRSTADGACGCPAKIR